MVVKRTAMGKQLQLFFTMFSTSVPISEVQARLRVNIHVVASTFPLESGGQAAYMETNLRKFETWNLILITQ